MGFLSLHFIIVLEELSTLGKVGVGKGYMKLFLAIVIFV